MNVWPIILCLVVAGVVMLATEVFIPGMIVGSIGLAALVLATVLCYLHQGVRAGNLLLAAELAGGIAFSVAWIKYLPQTPLARRWTLHEEARGQSQAPVPPDLLAKSGEAITPLRPSGTARIDGHRCDVVTRGEMIEAGARIEVIRIEARRIVVREVAALPA